MVQPVQADHQEHINHRVVLLLREQLLLQQERDRIHLQPEHNQVDRRLQVLREQRHQRKPGRQALRAVVLRQEAHRQAERDLRARRILHHREPEVVHLQGLQRRPEHGRLVRQVVARRHEVIRLLREPVPVHLQEVLHQVERDLRVRPTPRHREPEVVHLQGLLLLHGPGRRVLRAAAHRQEVILRHREQEAVLPHEVFLRVGQAQVRQGVLHGVHRHREAVLQVEAQARREVHGHRAADNRKTNKN